MERKDLVSLIVKNGTSVKEAMKQMDLVGLKILFVVDSAGKFIGTLTDGDFRRWILANKSFNDEIKKICNKKPIKFSFENYDIDMVKRVMVEHRLEAVPIVDNSQKIVKVLFWEDVFGNRYKKIEKKLKVPLAIMAGGEGARLSPFTKILPKPLIPINEKPIAEVIMDRFAEFGCAEFYFLLGYKGAMIQSYFDSAKNNYKPVYIFENKPGGTAGALKLLSNHLTKGSFFVSNCDILIEADYADMYESHIRDDNDITIVGAMRHFVVPYGIIAMEEGGQIAKLIEKPEYDFLVNTGMYILKKEVLSYIPKNEKFDFTDLIKKTREKGGKIGVYPVSEKSWLDIGQLELLGEAVSGSLGEKWNRMKARAL